MKYSKIKLPSKDITFFKQNNKTYVYYTIEKIYNKAKGFNENKRKIIGFLDETDKDYFYPNDTYIEYFGLEEISLNENNSQFSKTLSIGINLILVQILEKFYLNNLLNDTFPGKANLIKSLVAYYLDTGTSTIQLYEKWARRNLIFSPNIDSQATISRLFNEVITCDKTNEFLLKWNKIFRLLDYDKDLIVSLDTTNFNVNSNTISLAEYGKPKVDENLKQVNLAYIINNETSIPLYYQLFPGSIIDQSQCEELITKAKEFEHNNLTIVMDRGFYIAKNINFIEKLDYNYIIMAKSRNHILNELLDNVKDKIKNNSNFYLENTMTFGIKQKAKVIGSKEQYVYIYYSDEIAQARRKSFNIKIRRYKEQALSSNLPYENLVNMYGQFFDITEENGIRNIQIKKEVQQEEYDKAGFVCLVSNIDSDLDFIQEQYRKRDIVEKAFMALKSSLDFNKYYCSNGETLEAKVFIAFISIIVRSYLAFKLKKYFYNNTSQTINSVLAEFSKIEATKINKAYVQSYALTKTQKELLNYLEINVKEVNNYIKNINKLGI